jgi:hypothetical protein
MSTCFPSFCFVLKTLQQSFPSRLLCKQCKQLFSCWLQRWWFCKIHSAPSTILHGWQAVLEVIKPLVYFFRDFFFHCVSAESDLSSAKVFFLFAHIINFGKMMIITCLFLGTNLISTASRYFN